MSYTRHLFKSSDEPKASPISFRLPRSVDAQVRVAANGDLSGWLCQAAISYLNTSEACLKKLLTETGIPVSKNEMSLELKAVMEELSKPSGNRFRRALRQLLISEATKVDHGSPLWQICQEESH